MCQTVALTIPNVGDFFAWQILCDLLECKVLGSNTDDQWACLGPGAKNGLRRIFCLETTKGELFYTRLLRDLCCPNGPKSGFEQLGLKMASFLQKDLSLKVGKSLKEILMYEQKYLKDFCPSVKNGSNQQNRYILSY